MRGILLLLALATIAVITWIARGDRGDAGSGSTPAAAIERGYYMLDAHIYGTDDDGELLYELTADRALQTASREPIELSGIRMDYAGAKRADDGEVGPVTVRTDTLSFDPAARVVETEATVRFEIGGGSLVATGMRALLDEDRIELRSNIRGQFSP